MNPKMRKAARILLADDESLFRETLASFLRHIGYECICAPDSAAAMQLLAASDFDLLIADLEMPGNHDLALILRVSKVVAGLPVILLTAHPTMESAVQSVHLPVVEYVVKPPNLDDLRVLVRKSIERYRSGSFGSPKIPERIEERIQSESEARAK